MNKYIFSLVLVFISLNLRAQSNNINSIIEKYSGMNGVESVEISPALLSQMSGGKVIDSLVKNISSLKILTAEKKMAIPISTEINKALEKGFSKLMSINSNNSRVNIYLSDNNKILLSIVSDQQEYVLLYINGNITKYVIDSIINGKIKIK